VGVPNSNSNKERTDMFKNWSLPKVIPYILIIAGIVGIISAFAISVDEIKILQNPNYKPICDINPIISCGNVMQSKEASAFGFPNPYIGLAAFGSLLTVGVGMLAGAKFKRWFWLGLEAGSVFGIGFVHWLFFESVYRINALCPYCMTVWVITIATFWYVTLYNIDQGNIKLPIKLKGFYGFVRKHHLDIYIAWILIIAALILKHFWYYYGRYI
jgi:uncharacterized membrane protein